MLPPGERAKNARSISLPSLRQHYLVTMATSLAKSENMVQIYHQHPKRSHISDCKNRSSRSKDMRQNTPVFWPCRTRRSQMSSVNSVTRYTSIICAVNAHTEIAILHSISECQSDKGGEFAIFSRNRLPWLRYRKKRGPDRSSAPKTLLFGEKIAKIGPADPGIIVLQKIIKKKKKRKKERN